MLSAARAVRSLSIFEPVALGEARPDSGILARGIETLTRGLSLDAFIRDERAVAPRATNCSQIATVRGKQEVLRRLPRRPLLIRRKRRLPPT
jgi:hypothetical protein